MIRVTRVYVKLNNSCILCVNLNSSVLSQELSRCCNPCFVRKGKKGERGEGDRTRWREGVSEGWIRKGERSREECC